MKIQALFSAAAVILTFAIFVPYIRGILRGNVRPHVFTWIIWALGTVVVAAAQFAAHAGVGAIPIAISGCITIGIAVLAFLHGGDTAVTRSDWIFFGIALSALPAWFFTTDPLAAVVILTTVDLLGFGPTIRKSSSHPQDESASFFALGALRNALVVAALESYSLATVLFPAAIGIACLAFAGFIVVRRQQLRNSQT